MFGPGDHDGRVEELLGLRRRGLGQGGRWYRLVRARHRSLREGCRLLALVAVLPRLTRLLGLVGSEEGALQDLAGLD